MLKNSTVVLNWLFQTIGGYCKSIAICNCLKCSFSSSGSFGFCQTSELFAGWFLISYDRFKCFKAVFMFN